MDQSLNTNSQTDSADAEQPSEIYQKTLKGHKKSKTAERFGFIDFKYETRRVVLPYASAIKIMELLQDAVVLEKDRWSSAPQKLVSFSSKHAEFQSLSPAEMDDIRVAVLLEISEEKARSMRDGLEDIPF